MLSSNFQQTYSQSLVITVAMRLDHFCRLRPLKLPLLWKFISNAAIQYYMNDQTHGKITRFADDFSSAITADGEEITFTRFEAKSLMHFSKNPDRLVTRAQLLNVVSFEGSNKNDRNIDFMVNRIRKKLSDSAKDPQFIATRYGEGYIWIGANKTSLIANNDAYLVIGPVLIVDQSPDTKNRAQAFCQSLQKALKLHLHEDQNITIDTDCPPPSTFGTVAPELGVELTFFIDLGVLDCIVTVKKFREGNILAMTRFGVDGSKNLQGINDPNSLADWLLKEIWRARARIEHLGAPLPVAIQNAAEPTKAPGGIRIWKKNDIWMRKLISEHPDDPDIQLKYATHLHTKYIVAGHEFFQKGIDNRTQDEDEIERLIQQALPHIQSKPEQAIMAAKLLFFLDRGYSNFAVDLAEKANKQSTVISHSLPIIGQMRGFLGNIDHGIEALNQSINLAEKGSSTHLYSLVIKCSLHLAAGNADDLEVTKSEIYALRPAIKFFLEPFFTKLDPPSFSARAAIMLLTRKSARARLLHYNYVSSRLFQSPEHRANSIKTLLSLVIKRFDLDVVPAEISSAFPDLMNEITK